MNKNNSVIFYEKELAIKDKSASNSIFYCEIIGIYTDRPYVTITTVQNKRFHIQTSLSKIQLQLPSFFFRCNQSIIINMLYVREYNHVGRSLWLQTLHDKKEQISKSNKKEFIDAFFLTKDEYAQCIECLECKMNDKNKRTICIERQG